MEVEDVASTYTMVGAEGANVCVCDGKHFHLSKMCTPMANEVKWLFKEGARCISESCDYFRENTPTSHVVSVHMQSFCNAFLAYTCLCN